MNDRMPLWAFMMYGMAISLYDDMTPDDDDDDEDLLESFFYDDDDEDEEEKEIDYRIYDDPSWYSNMIY